ncbi:hypothetical protein A2U01_0092800 [Trifolium medium]|uniref:Uncharacterized protein n=1 Tax=Trifolium medium TaxID=97028 RepID=A0A392UFB7_9FABA|nr:hypothetical protein [Trifolium medium]
MAEAPDASFLLDRRAAPASPAQRAIDRAFPTYPQLRRATRQQHLRDAQFAETCTKTKNF